MNFSNVENFSSNIETITDPRELVNVAITLDAIGKTNKKMLDMVKSKLQTKAIQDIEDKNIKYVKISADQGSCEVSYKTKFEIDNYQKLKEILDEDEAILVEDKVTRKLEVKYDVESRFKQALIALCKGDYKENNIYDILFSLGLDEKAIKVLNKKLKGDYADDKELLESFGLQGKMEEELDAIREAKNYELITRFFDLNKIDIDGIKKAIWIEENITLTLNHNKV